MRHLGATLFGLVIVAALVLALYAIADIARWLEDRQRVRFDTGECDCPVCVDQRVSR